MPSGETQDRKRRSVPLILALVGMCALVALAAGVAEAHVFVSYLFRQGAYPPHDGVGWLGEAFLNVPNFDLDHHALLQGCQTGPNRAYAGDCRGGDMDRDGDVDLRDFGRLQAAFHDAHLLHAQRYVADREPDFTFRTAWIDFPAGPVNSRLDVDFSTVGDFLDDYIYDVSDPSQLDEPFGSLFLRFTGLVKITLEDEVRVRDFIGLPVWIDVGTMGYDGYQTRIGEVVYRFPNVRWAQPFYNWGPAVEVLGLFPIEITYLNVYDPDGTIGNERAGIEVYSWHGGGLPWPAGQQMVHEVFGQATLMPPRVIYQIPPEERLPVVNGDFDADYDIDLRDFRWYQYCADPDFFFLPTFCRIFDFDGNGRVDAHDYSSLQRTLLGPGMPPESGEEP